MKTKRLMVTESKCVYEDYHYFVDVPEDFPEDIESLTLDEFTTLSELIEGKDVEIQYGERYLEGEEITNIKVM